MGSTLTELITDERVTISAHVGHWRDAIRTAAEPLVADGSITESYVTAMIQAVEEFGPYIVLTPGLALAHARPEGGVNRQAMSVMTLAEPIEFGHPDNDPVAIVFCLAAVDDDAHLEALRQFVTVIKDRPRLERLISATSVEQLQRVLREEL